ncbi:MAG: hypothetical protein JSU81_00930 [Candidatus Coatesbacteria bacterium]|nr:MAG: hypothetical protein JSU81_00930 [Candidatus Coatesbacteria bacterium]
MKPKTILTVVILTFVAVSVVYLVVKEVKKATAPEAAPAGGEVASAETAATPAGSKLPPVGDRQIVVTYVYFGKRCATCLKIERYTEEALERGFASELEAGAVAWRTVDADEPSHKHYLTDYELYAKAVIVSDVRGGEEVRWKNLMKVWQLTGDKGLFMRYVQEEVRAYLTS